MPEWELIAWLLAAALAVALVVCLAALARARRRSRAALEEARVLRGMAMDPVGARLVRLDAEIEALAWKR